MNTNPPGRCLKWVRRQPSNQFQYYNLETLWKIEQREERPLKK